MQIDRRNALKKLAIGGVTAATASAVISSPVFGVESLTPPIPTVFAVTNQGTLSVTLTPADATCGGNASGMARIDGSAITASGIPELTSTVVATPGTDQSISATGNAPLTATFELTDSTEPAIAQINYFVNYWCTYATGSFLFCTVRTIRFTTVEVETSPAVYDWSTAWTIDPPQPGIDCTP